MVVKDPLTAAKGRTTEPMAGRAPVVAIVCSSGGLHAAGRVLSGLSATFAGAVIVLQHVSPDHRSMLPEILAGRTELPVAAARDGQPLLPGRVVVAPAGHHLLVTGDVRVALIMSGPLPLPRPSADLLLASLALACGADAIAVVLSGEGSDGATGTTACIGSAARSSSPTKPAPLTFRCRGPVSPGTASSSMSSPSTRSPRC